ncbi:MAG: ABC transporter permease subunit [Acutalibacteraceae bacterium]
MGESPATADAAGINVTAYKYLATCLGGGISGLGGDCVFVMEYSAVPGPTTDSATEAGLPIALVIFATCGNRSMPSPGFHPVWRSVHPLSVYTRPGQGRPGRYSKPFPYVVTIVVLVITSLRKKEDTSRPEPGTSVFQEER